MRTAWLLDFDGTIAPDVGARLVERFSISAPAVHDAWLKRWVAGEVGHRRLTEVECEGLRVSESEASAFALTHAIDPDFARFVTTARARGDDVMVVSEGFDFYVRDLLARAGLADLEVRANRAVFEHGGVRPEFPHHDPNCEFGCGNCKARHVRAYAARGDRTVMVGDGFSDRCGARAADRVFARAGLFEWCRANGIAAAPLADFGMLHALVAAEAAA